MTSLPLSDQKIADEIQRIVQIGDVNGYGESKIMDIIEKHQMKKSLAEF